MELSHYRLTMAAAPSDDDTTTCPLCHVTLASENELQLHYLQSCSGYDNNGNYIHLHIYVLHAYIHICKYIQII